MAMPSGWTSQTGRFIGTVTKNGVTYTVTTETNDKRCVLVTVKAIVTGTDTGATATSAQKQSVHEGICNAVNSAIGTGW